MNPFHLDEEFETDRLIIKKHSLDEAEMMYKAIDSDRGRLAAFMPWPEKIQNAEDELEFLRDCQEWWRVCQQFDYSIYLKENLVFLGNVGVHTIRWGHDCCEIGYWLLVGHEGQGYMREAVAIVEDHLFAKGFNRVEIRCDPNNTRSTKVPAALGYSYEGLLREQTKHGDHFRDTLVYSKIKKDR